MTQRVCAQPGCPTLIDTTTRAGRCDTHRREQTQQRGTTTQLGWGWTHQKTRAQIQARIDQGDTILCWRCRTQLHGRQWHLDHSDDRATYRGPACPHCNTSLAGQASAQKRAAK